MVAKNNILDPGDTRIGRERSPTPESSRKALCGGSPLALRDQGAPQMLETTSSCIEGLNSCLMRSLLLVVLSCGCFCKAFTLSAVLIVIFFYFLTLDQLWFLHFSIASSKKIPFPFSHTIVSQFISNIAQKFKTTEISETVFWCLNYPV